MELSINKNYNKIIGAVTGTAVGYGVYLYAKDRMSYTKYKSGRLGMTCLDSAAIFVGMASGLKARDLTVNYILRKEV